MKLKKKKRKKERKKLKIVLVTFTEKICKERKKMDELIPQALCADR